MAVVVAHPSIHWCLSNGIGLMKSLRHALLTQRYISLHPSGLFFLFFLGPSSLVLIRWLVERCEKIK